MAVTRRAIATMERTARRSPEVVVRITGRQHGAGHVLANFAYISRLGHGLDKELALHTSDGDVLRDGRDMQILAQDWHEWEMGDDARRAGATSISMILSMPTGTDPERLREAALAFARTEFANRSWVVSLHVDRDHPHVHLTFARRDLDGRRFHPDRDDLFRYRQRFAEKLRDRGIEANATPARARGIDPSHEPIAARKVREKGEVPRIDRSRAERVQRLREQGLPDPAQAALADRQAAVRATYERSIAELLASPSLVNKTVAQSVGRFVAAMPAPEPNSLRAARTADHAREAGGRAVSKRPDKAAAEPDALAASIARLKAATERSKASFDALKRHEERAAETERVRQPGTSDRLRALMEEANRQPAAEPPDKVAEILRQVQERDRAHRDRERERERDQSRDRGRSR